MSDKIIHIHDEDSEADTCRKEVLPKLYESSLDTICKNVSLVKIKQRPK